MTIPSLGADGLLPPGRYSATMAEIERAFVSGRSPERQVLWDRFTQYTRTWEAIERETGTDGRILLGYWIGGSFISAEPKPTDVDCSPILHTARLEGLRTKQAYGRAKRLIQDRDSVKRHFSVEVFPMRWCPVKSGLSIGSCSEAERHYLGVRGGLDTWWQRNRPPGVNRAPELPSHQPERGYVEVIL